MLCFHDANGVKTWQCDAGSLGAAPDLRPPSHQDQSLIPLQPSFTEAYYAQEFLSLSSSPISRTEAWMWGCRGKFGTNPKGEYYTKSHTHTQPPRPLFPPPHQSLQSSHLQPSHMDKDTHTHTHALSYSGPFPVKSEKLPL